MATVTDVGDDLREPLGDAVRDVSPETAEERLRAAKQRLIAGAGAQRGRLRQLDREDGLLGWALAEYLPRRLRILQGYLASLVRRYSRFEGTSAAGRSTKRQITKTLRSRIHLYNSLVACFKTARATALAASAGFNPPIGDGSDRGGVGDDGVGDDPVAGAGTAAVAPAAAPAVAPAAADGAAAATGDDFREVTLAQLVNGTVSFDHLPVGASSDTELWRDVQSRLQHSRIAEEAVVLAVHVANGHGKWKEAAERTAELIRTLRMDPGSGALDRLEHIYPTQEVKRDGRMFEMIRCNALAEVAGLVETESQLERDAVSSWLATRWQFFQQRAQAFAMLALQARKLISNLALEGTVYESLRVQARLDGIIDQINQGGN
jgi:hypothetical protein